MVQLSSRREFLKSAKFHKFMHQKKAVNDEVKLKPKPAPSFTKQKQSNHVLQAQDEVASAVTSTASSTAASNYHSHSHSYSGEGRKPISLAERRNYLNNRAAALRKAKETPKIVDVPPAKKVITRSRRESPAPAPAAEAEAVEEVIRPRYEDESDTRPYPAAAKFDTRTASTRRSDLLKSMRRASSKPTPAAPTLKQKQKPAPLAKDETPMMEMRQDSLSSRREYHSATNKVKSLRFAESNNSPRRSSSSIQYDDVRDDADERHSAVAEIPKHSDSDDDDDSISKIRSSELHRALKANDSLNQETIAMILAMEHVARKELENAAADEKQSNRSMLAQKAQKLRNSESSILAKINKIRNSQSITSDIASSSSGPLVSKHSSASLARSEAKLEAKRVHFVTGHSALATRDEEHQVSFPVPVKQKSRSLESESNPRDRAKEIIAMRKEESEYVAEDQTAPVLYEDQEYTSPTEYTSTTFADKNATQEFPLAPQQYMQSTGSVPTCMVDSYGEVHQIQIPVQHNMVFPNESIQAPTANYGLSYIEPQTVLQQPMGSPGLQPIVEEGASISREYTTSQSVATFIAGPISPPMGPASQEDDSFHDHAAAQYVSPYVDPAPNMGDNFHDHTPSHFAAAGVAGPISPYMDHGPQMEDYSHDHTTPRFVATPATGPISPLGSPFASRAAPQMEDDYLQDHTTAHTISPLESPFTSRAASPAITLMEPTQQIYPAVESRATGSISAHGSPYASRTMSLEGKSSIFPEQRNDSPLNLATMQNSIPIESGTVDRSQHPSIDTEQNGARSRSRSGFTSRSQSSVSYSSRSQSGSYSSYSSSYSSRSESYDSGEESNSSDNRSYS